MDQYLVRVWREGAEVIGERFYAANIRDARRKAREFLAANSVTLNATLHSRNDMQVPGRWPGGAAFVDLFIPSDIR